MERVWRELSSDLLEVVVTFLPLASLCRFRAVSKKWNAFLSHPDFASRHARASSLEEYVLIDKRKTDEFFSTRDWEVLDVANKRFFNLSDDFLAEFVKQKEIFGRCPRARWSSAQVRTILAADGGLLCLSYFVHQGSRCCCGLKTHEALLVCNPVLKTAKQLPHFAGWSERPEWVVMSTDRDSMEYEIFFINLVEGAVHPNAAYIYESKTTSWRTSAAVPGHLNALSAPRKPYSVSVVLKDEFYALFIHHDGLHAGLVSYNKVTGAVSDYGIHVPCVIIGRYCVSPQLVVGDGRLFCVIMTTDCKDQGANLHPSYPSSIEFVEFILARREYVHLSMLQGQMLDWFAHSINSNMKRFLHFTCDTLLVATGLANSIFLFTFAGQCVVYDLSNKAWHKYQVDRGYRTPLEDNFGSNLRLSLCPP